MLLELEYSTALPAMHGCVFCWQTAQILHIMIINVEEMNDRLTVMPCNQGTTDRPSERSSLCRLLLTLLYLSGVLFRSPFSYRPEVIKCCRCSHWQILATIASETFRIGKNCVLQQRRHHISRTNWQFYFANVMCGRAFIRIALCFFNQLIFFVSSFSSFVQ